ncbi:MAG: PhzF family phenazine biosynthesis protein [Polaribacter sp.]|nr:PhzF family phenazine biosynthesis protein [Polaribacter sp.]
MELDIFQIDAFTDAVFGGNPAAVCPLNEWIDEKIMQKIATENNVAETAFFVKKADNFEIRWFMPHAEIDLCGHATLASAFVIFNFLEPALKEVTFLSESGPLKAVRQDNGLIELNFPSRPPKKIEIPTAIFSAFSDRPIEAYASRDLILLFENEDQIAQMNPKVSLLKELPYLCIVPTARGKSKEVDFVSRVFDANATTMQEDPVTGSAHASLIPYWEKKLHKKVLKAVQLSERKGILYCAIKKERVTISGNAVLFLKGNIFI